MNHTMHAGKITVPHRMKFLFCLASVALFLSSCSWESSEKHVKCEGLFLVGSLDRGSLDLKKSDCIGLEKNFISLENPAFDVWFDMQRDLHKECKAYALVRFDFEGVVYRDDEAAKLRLSQLLNPSFVENRQALLHYLGLPSETKSNSRKVDNYLSSCEGDASIYL